MIERLTEKKIGRVRACIFDLDGTLADTLESIGVSCNEALAAVGLGPLPINDYKYYAGDGARTLVERAMRAAGAEDLARFDEVYEIYSGFFERDCTYRVTIYPGVPGLLGHLKARKVKLGVLSNKPHARTLDVIHKLFMEGIFDAVQGQTEGIRRKPAPDGVFRILKMLDVCPEECLYLGDTDVDMQTGNAAGLYTVGELWGFRDRAELAKNGADAIIERPEELLEFVRRRDNDEVFC